MAGTACVKILAALGVITLAAGCSTRQQTASALGVRCNETERLEPGTELVEDFALKNFGDQSRTEGTTNAIRIELLDRPTRLTRSELTAGLSFRVKAVNRIDQPISIVKRTGPCGGFEWVGTGILWPFVTCDFRMRCEEFLVIPPHEAQIVEMRLTVGGFVHLVSTTLKLRVDYFMLPRLVPLPARGIVPVLGHAASDWIEIAIAPD